MKLTTSHKSLGMGRTAQFGHATENRVPVHWPFTEDVYIFEYQPEFQMATKSFNRKVQSKVKMSAEEWQQWRSRAIQIQQDLESFADEVDKTFIQGPGPPPEPFTGFSSFGDPPDPADHWKE